MKFKLLFFRLQKFVDELLDALSSAGHVHKQFDHVKLHATIMNTLFRENKRPKEERVPGQRSRDRITFDATQILEVKKISYKFFYAIFFFLIQQIFTTAKCS